jgi:hypothetical protein
VERGERPLEDLDLLSRVVVGFVAVVAGLVTVTVVGWCGVVTGGTAALLLLKVPRAARIARTRARIDAAMMAACVVVSVQLPIAISPRGPRSRGASSPGSIQTSSTGS